LERQKRRHLTSRLSMLNLPRNSYRMLFKEKDLSSPPTYY
jgi:hypothetical protein